MLDLEKKDHDKKRWEKYAMTANLNHCQQINVVLEGQKKGTLHYECCMLSQYFFQKF